MMAIEYTQGQKRPHHALSACPQAAMTSRRLSAASPEAPLALMGPLRSDCLLPAAISAMLLFVTG